MVDIQIVGDGKRASPTRYRMARKTIETLVSMTFDRSAAGDVVM